MKKADLLAAVIAETGMKPAQVRKVMDSVLGTLKTTLEAGEDVQAPPLGRVRVIKSGEGATARTVYRVVLHGTKPAAAAAAAAAQPAATGDAGKGAAAKKSGWFGGR